MKKRLIVLTDAADNPAPLLKYAGEWALSENAELKILLQSRSLFPAFTEEETKKDLIQSAIDLAKEELKKKAGHVLPPGLNVSYGVSPRDPIHTLNELVKEDFDDLVLLGIKKMGFFEKIFMGNPAVRVIENIENIVVGLPGEIDTYTHEKIFVAVPENPPVNLLEFNNLLKFIDPKDTSITFFHLSKPGETTHREERILKEMTEMFSDRFRTNYEIYEGIHAFTDIKKVINSRIDEILVVQKGSRLLTDVLFRKFLINELVYDGETPLIILP